MADRDVSLGRRRAPVTAAFALAGGAALLAVLALVIAPLGAVIWRAQGPWRLGPADIAALRFTLLQATLSALISIGLAIPVARALARRRFLGRRALVALMGAPFILPVVVAVLGLLAVFGRAGLVNTVLGALGLPPVSIYGLHGVVLAHVFFNLPLATRLILQGWLSIPAERFRLAAMLGLGPGPMRRLIERPMLREVVPGALVAVFLLCLTSFAVALTLGGGPRATTIELAIYQAFRFDFDLGRAALLALVQFGLGLGAALLAWRVAAPAGLEGGLDRTVRRWDSAGRWRRVWDGLVIGLAALFLLLPLGAVVLRGIEGLGDLPASVLPAALRSVGVALAATTLTLALALPLAVLSLVPRLRIAEVIGMISIAMSPLALGTGLFILVFRWADPASLALPLTALVNALMALPFALRVLRPSLVSIEAAYGALADHLGLTGLARLRLLWLPRLRRPLGFAAGLAAALAVGDLGVIALFAAPDKATLPLEMYRLMGAYRMDAAAGAALVMLILAFGLFVLFDRGGRLDADA